MKKNKKGFTLIELLAIIVILAVIAVITTPIILNIIENSKKGAATNSALGYKDAIQKYYASKLFEDNNFKLQGEFDIDNQGAISNELEEYQIAFSGTTPSGGYATIENGKLISGCVQINEYAVRFEEGSVSETKKGNCGPVLAEAFPQVTDENPGIICGNGETEDYDNSTVCYIYSVEDLVAFSNMVNSGKNFSGKTVHLMNNLDIQNDKSYVNPSINQFGDINENNTISETLKEELTDTEAKGFKPIGNSSNKFSGIFEGNTHTLKDIFINRSSIDYVGIFGYNNGTIKGIKLIDVDVKGKDYTGLIAGYNTGNITSTITTGTLSGSKKLGLAVGKNDSGTVESVVRGNITSTFNSTGNGLIGGIVGITSNGTVKGINQGGTISVNSGNAYRTIGSTGGSPTMRTVSSNTVTTPNTNTSSLGQGGLTVNSAYINNIATLERVLDTYVNGDNNKDGYYYDNDENGDVTIYSTTDHPLTITMTGTGTSEDPYIITNYEQLKEASYDTTKAYRLAADIDMQGKNPILLAGYGNSFSGIFEGNGHTLSNATYGGNNYVALFGYNESTGKIKGLKLENINIVSYEISGIICGENHGDITETIAKGNVSGYTKLGLAVGYNYGTVESIVQGNITSSFSTTNSEANVGGIVGNESNGTVKGINQGGTITVSAGKAYRTVGTTGGSPTMKTIASSTATAPTSSNSIGGKGGATVNVEYINNIAALERVLDTYVAGDNNNDGYYYDNDEDGNATIKNTRDNPLTRTMSGEGTSEDPYIITSYDQLKEAAYNTTKTYRLDADINMQGKNTIILAGYTHSFSGTFDGNGHTISNGTIGGSDYVGMFGYNETSGTIKGLKLENINVGAYELSGIISGENHGTITDVIATGNISGYTKIG